ncbi:tankyrase-1-like isoform X1 [Varroa jacobsoni]|uniref:tankyrase-1-like isoform X1 n=1 Tax=Varroa jacobsoni TaxID=62625 RepID=UPI000BF8B1EC|nr:tankyrase-1-like isoform X1 [Varroa jacobsoni]
MAGGGGRTRHDSGVETDSDGSTTAMSVGSPPHRNNYPSSNQLDEGIIDAPSVSDLPPQEVKLLEIPRPQQMDMCPLVNDNSGLPLAAEERMSLKEGIISIPPLKNIDNGTENHTQQFFLEMKPSNKPAAPSSDDCSQSIGGGKILKHPTCRGRVSRVRANCMYPKKPPRKSDDNALREAAAANDVARCEELLKNGARADACDSRRRTALHFAATIRGGVPLVNLLLRHGADPNAQDVAGNTPMHLAICIHNGPVIQELLNHGSDLTAVDRSGRNPLQLATNRLRLILAETSKGAQGSCRHEVSEGARKETLKMITCLQQYCEQWKHNPTLAASALLFGSLKERILVSENPSQFNSEVSDLLTSLEHLQLL